MDVDIVAAIDAVLRDCASVPPAQLDKGPVRTHEDELRSLGYFDWFGQPDPRRTW